MLKKRKNIIIFAFVLGLIVSLTATNIFADKTKKPAFPVNANGQTYGSDMGIENPEDAPDLILIRASNGKEGYSYKEEVYAQNTYADYEVKLEKFREAMKKDPDVKVITLHSIPVYESDGKTVIGEHVQMFSPYLSFSQEEDGKWYDGLGNLVTEFDEDGYPAGPEIVIAIPDI